MFDFLKMKKEEMKWSIILINDNNWYVSYMKNKLSYQIDKLKLQEKINIFILDKTEDIEKIFSDCGDYINIIDNGDVSDKYIEIIYKNIKNCKKDCIVLNGLIYINNKSKVFNQISKEHDGNQIYLPISKLNPIKKNIIIENIEKYWDLDLSEIIKSKIDIKEPVIFMENKTPFSIIITAYQTQDFIEECLDSIENQTYFKNNNDFEVLVGIDYCKDTFNKVNEIKDKYRNLHIYMMSENRGTYITTNTLLDFVKYENIIRFDSDDIMCSNLIETVLNNKRDNDIIKLGYVEMKNGVINDNIIVESGIIFFKKSVIDNIAGGYKPWVCAADTELIKRLDNKVKISEIKEKLFYRRIHDNSLTNRLDTGYNSSIRLEYTNQIKSYYNDDEVKIERIVNDIRKNDFNKKEKYNFIYMITTFNRIEFLKKTITTWYNTIDKNNNWVLIVSDDGSNDGTLEYLYNLHFDNIKIFIIENKRRGVHHQTNSLLKFVNNFDFDFGFKSDDDLIFLKRGWDIKYFNSSKNSNFYHLIFYDKKWGNRRGEKKESLIYLNLLENSVNSDKIQGAFWTFNKKLINEVGFFDTSIYNLCGLGHVDYSLRCCRLGYNDINNPYDIKNSNSYITLNTEKYFSNNDFKNIWNTKDILKEKKENLFNYRTYISYNQSNKNLLNEDIQNYDISFIIPLRDRKEQIQGLEYNIKKYFSKYEYEIIYVNQNDNKLFRRGQLCNIGFKESKGQIIVFQDVDIRHLNKIDMKELLDEYKKPFVAFDKITQLKEYEIGKYEIIETEDRPYGWGACAVFYREQFIISGGFSNLIFGWGAEDNIMNGRVNYERYQQNLGHVYHIPLRKDPEIFSSIWYKNNRKMLDTDKDRDPMRDGYIQTDYSFDEIKDKNIKIIDVNNIGVKNFEYLDLYEDCLKNDVKI